jgi:hypothetical protein
MFSIAYQLFGGEGFGDRCSWSWSGAGFASWYRVPRAQMLHNFKPAMVTYLNSACWLCMDLHMFSVVSGRMCNTMCWLQVAWMPYNVDWRV